MSLLIAIALAGSMNQDLKGQSLLDDLSRRAVNYFWERSHPSTHFTKDRSANFQEQDRPENRVSSIAAIGYALSAYAIGAERGWLPKEAALDRARNTLRNVRAKAPQHRGWYYHFFDWETGERIWNCELSSIDTAILLANMLIAERGFNDPEFSRLSDDILKQVDWKWMLTDGGALPDSKTFAHGWKPEEGFLKNRWAEYCEHMMLYVVGMGASDDVSDSTWTAWRRPIIRYKDYETLLGGPLFIHQMSHGMIDFKNRRDVLGYDYWVASYQQTLAQRAYCMDNPQGFKGYGPDIWGLSACDVPDGYRACGAPGWIDDDGTLAPAAAAASVMFDRELAIRAAEAFLRDYPNSYGRYGFTTGLNPNKAWQSPDVIGIDLGQLLLCLEVARDGLPHLWSMSHPVIQRGMSKAGFRLTDEGPSEKRSLRKTS